MAKTALTKELREQIVEASVKKYSKDPAKVVHEEIVKTVNMIIADHVFALGGTKSSHKDLFYLVEELTLLVVERQYDIKFEPKIVVPTLEKAWRGVAYRVKEEKHIKRLIELMDEEEFLAGKKYTIHSDMTAFMSKFRTIEALAEAFPLHELIDVNEILSKMLPAKRGEDILKTLRAGVK